MRVAGRKAKTESPVKIESRSGICHPKRKGEGGRFPGPRFLGKVAVKFGAEMIGEKIIQFRGPRGNGNLERR